jgi:hypothetical protein
LGSVRAEIFGARARAGRGGGRGLRVLDLPLARKRQSPEPPHALNTRSSCASRMLAAAAYVLVDCTKQFGYS